MSRSVSFSKLRRWPRFAVDMPVQVRVTTQGPTRTLACEGQGSDISVGGLAVTVDIDLNLGTQIGVEFTPPFSHHSMTLRGFVRNREGNRYGIEFITENDADYRNASALQAVLSALSSHPA